MSLLHVRPCAAGLQRRHADAADAEALRLGCGVGARDLPCNAEDWRRRTSNGRVDRPFPVGVEHLVNVPRAQLQRTA
jgi:hypothetical protein